MNNLAGTSFSLSVSPKNKYGGIRASHSPSNQVLLAVQTIVGLPEMVQSRSYFQRFATWPVFKLRVTGRRRVRQSGNHCSADCIVFASFSA